MKNHALYCLLFYSISVYAVGNQMDKVRSAITRKDYPYLEKTLVENEDAHQAIKFIKNNRQELINLAENTKTLTEAKEKLGEKKYTKWKRIGFGATLTGYAALKLILGTVFNSDELESSEEQGFFTYDRLTDISICGTGFYWIYYGITGKDPKQKLDNASAILKLLQEKLPAEEL